MIYRAHTAHALSTLGEHLGRRLFAGAVLLLEGELGAGKTTFAQGVARGLGVTVPVLSPTYAIVHEYPDARLHLCHADVYRLEAEEELVSAGIVERIGEEGVWLVEWANRFPTRWPAGHLVVRIQVAGEGREVELVAADAAHAALLDDHSPPPNTM